MLAFAASLLCLCTPAIADEEDEVGETIVINPEEYHNQGGHNRAPVFIPFEAVLMRTLSLIYIELLYPVDDLSVTLTNLVTADSTTFTLGATQNNYIPITLGCGLYRIEFTINNETNYYGIFHL